MQLSMCVRSAVFSTIKYGVHDRVATITLNRPHVLNAIILPMPEEIEAAVVRANADADVRAIVLTGSGRAFCSGYDLKEYAECPRGSTTMHIRVMYMCV